MAKPTAIQWEAPRAQPDLEGPALEMWQGLTQRLLDVARSGNLSMAEVCRRADIPQGTLSPWYHGVYTGNYASIGARMRAWLDAQAESQAVMLAIPAAPGFVETPTARRVIEALIYAQSMPEFSVATLGAGMGKTMTARHFVATRPNAFLVTMRPSTSGRHPMLQELALALDVVESNPARLDRAIGDRLRRNGRQTLLILDEAQNLVDDAVNQLRYFNDEYGCGIALLGNEAVYRRFGTGAAGAKAGDTAAQVQSRIGLKLLIRQPTKGDVDALLDGWQITDPEIRRLAQAIARKPGALRQVDKVLKLGWMLARGAGTVLASEHLRQAWSSRGGEDIA